MDLWDGDCGVHDLCEGGLEEIGVGPSHNAYVMGVKLYVNDLLVLRAGYRYGTERRIYTGV